MLRKYLTDYLSQIQNQIDEIVEENKKYLKEESSGKENEAGWFFKQGWLMSLYIEKIELRRILEDANDKPDVPEPAGPIKIEKEDK